MADGEVWIKTCGGKSASVYHTNAECWKLDEAFDRRSISVEDAERRALRECAYCAGEVTPTVPDEQSFAQRIRSGELEVGDD